MCAHTSQDLLKRKVVQTLEREMKKKLTVTAGWYTETQMAKKLDFTDPQLQTCLRPPSHAASIPLAELSPREDIKAVVEYTSTRPALRRRHPQPQIVQKNSVHLGGHGNTTPKSCSTGSRQTRVVSCHIPRMAELLTLWRST